MLRYYFGVDSVTGKVMIGTAVDVPAEYTVEGTQEVWENQERAFYDAESGTWTVYDRLTASGPASASVGETITVTATLPAGSPDTEMTFRVQHGTEMSDPVTVQAVDGIAEQQFSFDVKGSYTILVSSVHHGTVSVGVTVSVGNQE